MHKKICLAGSAACMGLFAGAVTLPERYSNEWMFESDPAGSAISAAINSGTDTPKAQFGAGFAQTIFTTNHPSAGNVLLCIGNDPTPDQNGTWTSGAILDASIDPLAGRVHYLRYDIEYDFSSGQNSSVAGVYFANDAAGRMGGIVIGSFTDNTLLNSAPDKVRVIPRSELGDVGRVTVIVEINYTWPPAVVLRVWYRTDESVPFNYADNQQDFWQTLVHLDTLRFHATGDIRPDGTDDYIAVQNIRHTVGDTFGGAAWEAILEPLVDLTVPPALDVEVTDSLGGSMVQGETNLVSVIVSNPASGPRFHPATDVTSQLTHDGGPSAFTLSGSKPPSALLRGGESVTNVYEVIAHETGIFTFEAVGLSAQTNSTPSTFDLHVRGLLWVQPVTDADIVEVSGGSYPGFYEPGETLHIPITTTNQGHAAVSDAFNTLGAPPGFTVTALDSQVYGGLNPGDTATTIYEVVIGETTPLGIYPFEATSTWNSQSSTTLFDLEVSTRLPYSDWVKADNSVALNDPASWVIGQIPDATDRALMDATVTTAITTPLGGNHSWRGITLVSNTVDWTISGTDILTIGPAGIDMADAQGNLAIASRLHLGTTQTWDVAEGRTLNVTGIVTGMNTEPLVKRGKGTVRLTNPANMTLRGGVRVEEGILQISGSNVLGSGDLSIGDATLSTSAAASLTNRVHLTGGAELANAHALTLRGVIGGPGSLAKSGGGDLILGRANLYTGGTTISGVRVELQNNRALGTGPVTMHTGSRLYAGVDNITGKNATSPSTPLTNPIEVLGNVTFETLPLEDNAGLMVVDGDISGPGKITIEGFQFHLRGDNRNFTGGIDLTHDNWLWVTRHALGTGPLTTLRYVNVAALEPMEISNPIVIDHGFRLHNAGHDVVLSGSMSGGGQLLFIHSNAGVVTITGDNSGRSGSTMLRQPLIRLGHRNALGTGNVLLEPQFTSFEINVLQQQTGPDAMGNDWIINRSFMDANSGDRYPVRFNLDHDLELTGSITQRAGVAALPVEKEGPGTLILSGPVNIPGAINIFGGSLVVNTTALSERIAMAEGTVLSGTGTVGDVLLRAGSILHLSDAMTFQQPPEIQPGAKIVLDVVDTTAYGAIVGTGPLPLELTGALVLDFAGSTVAPADAFHILRDWAFLTDDGVEVIARNLPADLVLNTSQLFTQGRVTLDAQATPVPPPVEPGEIVKDANNDSLNLASSWVGGIVPGAQDRARLDSRVWSPLVTSLGAETSWRGIALVSNVVDWTIRGTEPLTIGSGGIDMRRANGDLRIGSRLFAGAPQQWDVATGRTLTLFDRVTSGEGTVITKTGEGHLRFPAGVERRITGELVVSNGTLAVSGGFNRMDDLRIEAGTPPVGTGRIRFSGGTTLATAGGAAGLGNPMTIDQGMLRVNPGQEMLLAGVIDGAGGLVHDGSGTLRLAGANSYSGGTIVENGSTLQFTSFRAFGLGTVTLNDGSHLQGWLPDDKMLPRDRTVNNRIFLEGGRAIIEKMTDQQAQIFFAGDIFGPGAVRFVLPAGWGRHIYLSGRNTFEGDLEIFKPGLGDSVVYASGPQSLGSGEIVCLVPDTRLGFSQNGGRVGNRINLLEGTLNFILQAGWNMPDLTVEFAGEIYGNGSIAFVNRPGTIRLSADNRNWTGGISGIGSHNVSEGVKRVIVEHPNALGTGQIVLGGHTYRRNYVEMHIRAPVDTRNDLFASDSGPEKDRNDLLAISYNSVFGKLDGVPAHHGLDKTGPGRMTLTAPGNYPSPFNVREGTLELDAAGFPGRTTVSPGAGLLADDARTGPVRIRSGGSMEAKGGGLRIESGALTLEGDALMTLRPSSAQAGPGYIPLLTGDGSSSLTLSGTLLVDFSAINPAPVSGDFVKLFGDWAQMVNNEVIVLAAGLDDFMTLEPSTLFSDGRVRVVDGGRTSSQDLLIKVTSGGTGSGTVQVRNPENVIRYFRLKPGAGWPSWLSATPTSARTAVGPGAQATIAVTANATGLPAGTHRFMLPVVWEHGVSDLIQITVQVEGPSLMVAPGALTLPVVEETTGDGTVDLINNGTLPVSYRIRRVLAEQEIYTQPAADVPWITVPTTAQTEITSFASGRSAPRAIGFGFPFFGKTETEVSVGIDGTLWFGGKPAIRAFSNELSYQSGFSKVTTKPEEDRFIVTWNRMVQPDSAQQTFQAVLHRDGRIDLRYDQIVADSAWRNALIGLHGPTQWFPAQVPEPLQGRTIRFAPGAETARISIPQISGTVAAGEDKTITVTGDATGLTNGDLRTAIFAIGYDGGLAGTAGEVAVTMNVIAPAPDPVGDGLRDDLAPPFYPYEPDPVVVLNPPQRIEGGRKITWRVDGEYGGMHPSDTTVYRIETTTNLLSGSWEDLISVTNKREYTDEQPMDGPVIFYRIIKE